MDNEIRYTPPAESVPSFASKLVAGQMRRRWINKEAERLHWERYGDPEDGTHDTLIDCANDAIEAWYAEHNDGDADAR